MSLFFRFQALSGRQYFDNLIVTSAKSLADLSLTRFTQGVSKTSSRARKRSSRSVNNESLVISYCTRRRATHSFVRRSISLLTFPLITKKIIKEDKEHRDLEGYSCQRQRGIWSTRWQSLNLLHQYHPTHGCRHTLQRSSPRLWESVYIILKNK